MTAFADVVLDPTDGPSMTNIVPNPSFGYDATSSDPAGWGFTGGTGTWTRHTVDTYLGKHVMRLTTTLAAGANVSSIVLTGTTVHGVANSTAVSAGQQVAMVTPFHVLSVSGANIVLEWIILWYDSSGTALSSSNNVATVAPAAGDHLLSGISIAPAGATEFSAFLTIVNNGSTGGQLLDVDIQGACIVVAPPGGVVPSYFDGDQLGAAPATAYQWTGALGSSSSQRIALRTPLPLVDSLAIDQAGINWGDATITAYQADMDVGSAGVDYRLPNRTVTIPLGVGMDDTGQFNAASEDLRAKVALFQREGGWLQRQPGLYAEIVNATLTFPDQWGEPGGLETGVSLQLECLPDFFGDEIILDSASMTGAGSVVLQQSAAPAVISGDHPGRCRIKVTDTSGNAKNSLLWGFRSRHYDSASTAALMYEAEALTPVGGASITSLSGASGGSTIAQTALPANSWVTVLSTNLLAGSPMTHQGSYRMWARVYATAVGAAVMQLRLLWGVGSLSVPIVNNIVSIPGISDFYLVDLGEIRVDPSPVGPPSWYGGVQVYSPAGGAIYIDKVYYQPLDDGAGTLQYTNILSTAVVVAGPAYATNVSTNHTGSQQAWSNPSSALSPDSNGASVEVGTAVGGGGTTSDLLNTVGYGFAIPSGTTVVGIKVEISMSGLSTAIAAYDNEVKLLNAGSPVGSNKAIQAPAPTPAWMGGLTYQVRTYGGSNDLWGATWLYSDVNNANFGVQFQGACGSLTGTAGIAIDYMRITVFYEYSGFVVPTDAVVYPNEITEIRTEGAYRANSSGVYGKVSKSLGRVPRIPPSGMENRPVELFLRPSRGDLASVPDEGLDGFTAQVLYRSSSLFRT